MKCLRLIAVLALAGLFMVDVHSAKAQTQHHSGSHNYTTGTRKIDFSGTTWTVKSGFGGPGPNNWSDSQESVWLDDLDRLHMKIREINGVWHSAEIYTDAVTSHGEHRFLVEGQVDDMDRSAVLGLFVYFDDLTEIDIEYSKWGAASRQNVGQFVIQPYGTGGNLQSFVARLDTSLSTHLFNWQPDSITFASIQGLHQQDPPSVDEYIHRWNYRGNDNPDPAKGLRTRINLWMFRGASPVDTTNLEVIIRDVFQPLSPVSSIESKPPARPETFTLFQNHPNPFNPQTTIRYAVGADAGASAVVRLRVFNLRGQLVRVLVDASEASGRKSVLWDGRDDFGHEVASGLYFYQLQVNGGLADSKKMLLLR